MKKKMQQIQHHPPKSVTLFSERRIRTIQTKVGIRKKNIDEPQAILPVMVRPILRACLEDYRKAKRYCGYWKKSLSFIIRLAFLICNLTFPIIISSCGYSTRSLLPNYLQKVHIKLFENQTLKVRLDELATDAVIEAFRSGSNLRIVDENSADIVIEGKISGFSKDPYVYTSDQTIIEYKISVKFSIRCVDKVRNEIFWEGSVSDWATYDTDEEGAIDEAIKKTADRLVNAILTNW